MLKLFVRNAFLSAMLGAPISISVAAALPPPPPDMPRLALTYDSTALSRVGGAWVLPQLYVVDLRTGYAADEDMLPEALRSFVKENRTPANALMIKAGKEKTLLDGLMEVSRHPDSSPLKKSELTNKRYAIFQLWAEWCTGCLEEAKQLSEMLKAHPMRELAWIAVEADPTKGRAEVVHVKDPHELRGPHGKPVKLDASGMPIVGADGQLLEE